MNTEQELLSKWSTPPKEKQDEVLYFVESLRVGTVKSQSVTLTNKSQHLTTIPSPNAYRNRYIR